MSFSPVKASQIITEQYKRYLATIFRLNDPVYQKQFIQLLYDPKSFATGPYLEASDTFETADTTRALVEQGKLPKGFLRLGFFHDRPLYRHQQNAITEIQKGNNIVVTTGTGSGKTESFLIPIMSALVQEYQQGTLNHGVRALLIYPMNALANDQVEKLRSILKDFPQIKFGCYTGQTKEKYRDALREYQKLNHGEKPIASELISREQMKQTPPHILITNYAMLEYLMLRPEDAVFFRDDTWKFVVLDEAHVYRGSTGIEVSMLLRRLNAALPDCSLQYILTSATLGDEDENKEVAQFAHELCNSIFNAEHVIRAKRISVPVPEKPLEVPPSFYHRVLLKQDQGIDITQINRDVLLEYPQWELRSDQPLYDVVHRDKQYWRLRNLLQAPCSFMELPKRMGQKAEEIEDFISVAAQCDADGIRLLDARYHMFLRATESVFITLAPHNRMFLTRRSKYMDDYGQAFTVFEISTCSICHAIYLVGKVDNDYLVQSAEEDYREVFYLGGSISDTDEDHLLTDEGASGDPYLICSVCGHLYHQNAKNPEKCEHSTEFHVPVIRMKVKGGVRELKKCVACEAVNTFGILRSFFTGQEAVTSVIATSLFNSLPDYTMETKSAMHGSDDFGFGAAAASETIKIQQAKQFLCFSDSRQASAYFAFYLDRTYRSLLYKRLVAECLSQDQNAKSLTHFCEDLSALFDRYHVLDNSLRSRKESWKALLAEAADMGSVTSLFNAGQMVMGIEVSQAFPNEKLNLSQEDVATLINVLISSMMNDVAIFCPEPMTEEDRSFYAYGITPCRYVLSGSDARKNIRGFVPVRENLSNKRLDYLTRVLKEIVPTQASNSRKILESIWGLMKDGLHLLKSQPDGYQLDVDKLMVLQPRQWSRCNKCNRITPYDVAQVCPTYRCEGKLQSIDPSEELIDDHYYRLYKDMGLHPLRIEEHTAQLDRDTAYLYQQKFKDKQIDVLSCSTTFEMGVDVGSLETVFMRNMPPLPSNYAQRAGRAGRSKKSAAFALTFCNRSNHDFSFFRQPTDMIRGRIHAPHFSILNDKIAIRHLYASTLAFFWKRYSAFFSTVGKFASGIDDQGQPTTGLSLLNEFLRSQPPELKQYLKRFLPAELYSKFDCENFGWVDSLLGTEDQKQGKLVFAMEEYKYEVGLLNEAIQEAVKSQRSTGYYVQRIRTYERESILSFMSRRNVLPQYGFPVDTVELQVDRCRAEQLFGVELQRDLAMAIAEYAPGSEVVANGTLFTGRYIKKMPKIGWKMYDFVTCDECNTLNIDPNTGVINERLSTCKVCGSPLESGKQKTFLIPSFGFEADPDAVKKPGLMRPKRTYRGDVSFVGYRKDTTMTELRIDKALVNMQYNGLDEMAVLNNSDFYVCETCGYAEVGLGYMHKLEKEHKMSSGKQCVNHWLKRLSLGYRFETDVFQLRFLAPNLQQSDWEQAISVLNALLRGICKTLDLEDQDVNGCLQCFLNSYTNTYCYGFVFYDTTPGGAGHVKRLVDEKILRRTITETLRLMHACHCGGDEGDSSCYSCLRSFQNQKVHDHLKRNMVMEFLSLVCD